MMRARILILIAAGMPVPLVADAGELFGTLREGGASVAAGVKIEVKADGKVYTAQTDASGGFRLFIPAEGKFPLMVYYKNKTPTLNVVSFESSVRYDLMLEPAGGDYVLKRQ